MLAVAEDRNTAMADISRKSIFDMPPDDAAEAQFDAEAEADADAGRVVPHEEVVKWLKSWGTADELPCPTPKPR
jgi:predicted transcriptional regulator